MALRRAQEPKKPPFSGPGESPGGFPGITRGAFARSGHLAAITRITVKTLLTSKQTAACASGRSAYTIIETIVAMAVAGVLFAASLAGFSYGFSGVQADRENSRAVQILLEKMELVRLYNWAQITRADTNTYLPATFTAPFYPTAANNGGLLTNYTTVLGNNWWLSLLALSCWSKSCVPNVRRMLRKPLPLFGWLMKQPGTPGLPHAASRVPMELEI